MTASPNTHGTTVQRAALEARVVALLADAGVRGGDLSISLCSQGANNRIHRVRTPYATFAVKEYFRHADDPRDRLAAETAFLEYAHVASPGTAPQLLASHAEAGLTLIEFVDGVPVAPGSVGAAHIDAAIAFFRDLNAPARRASARLPIAAEATFSVGDQLALIDARIAQLLAVDDGSDVDAEFRRLMRRLADLWSGISGAVRATAAREGLDDGADIRCVSPSDFGFHNALVTTDGRLRFIDFEYAGWDDPAKMAGDFFAQIAVPVPLEHFDRFVTGCAGVLPHRAAAARRAMLMRAAYQVKWCCIALNVFLPVHLTRRRFANPALDEVALKRTQMEKAERLMAQIAPDAH